MTRTPYNEPDYERQQCRLAEIEAMTDRPLPTDGLNTPSECARCGAKQTRFGLWSTDGGVLTCWDCDCRVPGGPVRGKRVKQGG